MPRREVSDETLADQAKRGDHSAFAELIERYMRERKIKKFISKYFKKEGYGGELADDALSETFERMWKYRENFDRTKGKFSSWVYTIAKNVCKEILEGLKSDYKRKDPLWKNATEKLYGKDGDPLVERAPIIDDPSWKPAETLDAVLESPPIQWEGDDDGIPFDLPSNPFAPRADDYIETYQDPTVELSPEQKAKNEKILRNIKRRGGNFLLSPAEKASLGGVEKRPPKLSAMQARIRKLELEGKNREEIAKILGKTRKQIRSAIYRKNNKFREKA